jgi:dTDP-L-rhamnose 4-epimerase
VHAGKETLAPDLVRDVQVFRGDIRDQALVARALDKQDAVVHLAAETGTGQSMYEIPRYQDVNIGGTAALLSVLVNGTDHHMQKFIVASSRAIYGEGKYRCEEHGVVYPSQRSAENLHAGKYEPHCPLCDAPCNPEATTEDSPFCPLSFYGLTKQVQEQMVLLFARAQGFSAFGLRYQNVYGPGQSLNNPYTGILAIFANVARSNSAIQVFEDGQESRDFVYVEDAVEATWLCLQTKDSAAESFNVGTGKSTTVLQVAREIVGFLGSTSAISITGAFRLGDIRHNFASTEKIQRAVGFVPRTSFAAGLKQFLCWAKDQETVSSGYESSLRQLQERGLLRG